MPIVEVNLEAARQLAVRLLGFIRHEPDPEPATLQAACLMMYLATYRQALDPEKVEAFVCNASQSLGEMTDAILSDNLPQA